MLFLLNIRYTTSLRPYLYTFQGAQESIPSLAESIHVLLKHLQIRALEGFSPLLSGAGQITITQNEKLLWIWVFGGGGGGAVQMNFLS